jgi:glycosyltransferase involved in cell wall biosynthesis
MLKIAIVSEHASPLALLGGVDSGGQNVYVASIARQLARSGHHVDVFTRRDNPLLPSVVHWKKNVRVVHVDAGPRRFVPKEELLPHMDAFGESIAAFFRDQQRPYDVIHANFFMSGLAGLRVRDEFDAPLVMTFHALGRVRRKYQRDADRFPDERFDIEARLIAQCDRIVAECPQDKADMLDLYGAAEDKIDIVPCGFDPEELWPVDRAEARTMLGWRSDEFNVLQLGRLVPRKGVDNVIRALALLRGEHGVDARLHVVGGNSDLPNMVATPEIERLARLALDLGVADEVEFVGRRGRDALPIYYSAADVFVTTPWYEPFGITPVEAMACATPVVGAAVGGIPFTVEHERTGLLVPPRDPCALASCLARLHGDPALARRLAQCGHAQAKRAFTWRHVSRALLGVYERARHVSVETAALRAGASLQA